MTKCMKRRTVSPMTLRITGKRNEWYIRDPQGRMDDCGPYTTRDEAEEDRRGMERFFDVEAKRKVRT